MRRSNAAASDDATGAETEHTTWADLQAHAAFPAAATTIEPETIDIPLGMVDCLRYTVPTVRRCTSSGSRPPIPACRYASSARVGRATSTTTMIASEIGPA